MKKIIYISTFFAMFFWVHFFVQSENIDELFTDIDEEYILYQELEYIYDKWLIIPDNENILNRDRKIRRWEFINYAFELSCDSCKQDTVSPRIAINYRENQSFFDVENNEDHFYCSEEANAKQYLLNFPVSHSCDNGISQNWSSPFCSENGVSKQEALRAVMLISGIYTQQDFVRDLELLATWGIETNLWWWEIQAFDFSGEVNPYFLYLRKALSYSIEVADLSGNFKDYTLLKADTDWKIWATDFISREDFLYMLYVISKSVLCEESRGDFASNIDIYPGSCVEWESCARASLEENVQSYDLVTYPSSCPMNDDWEAFDPENNIIWRLHHLESNTYKVYMWDYVDNAMFDKEGEWRIYLWIFDSCGKSSTAMSSIYIWESNNWKSSLNIDANPPNIILWNDLILNALYPNWTQEDFIWQFSNGATIVWEEVSYEFLETWVFKVDLQAWDSEAFVYVNVYERAESEFDVGVFIDIFWAECSEWQQCEEADLENTADSYDFLADHSGTCSEWVDDSEIFWTFKNITTWATVSLTWEYIDNFDFSEDWIWSIFVQVTDKCGEYGSANSYLAIWDTWNNSWWSLSIEADGVNVTQWDTINFSAISSDPNADDFVWNFWDGNSWTWENTSHIFDDFGVFTVQLESGWNTSFVTIRVSEDIDEWANDQDWDGIPDNEDSCPTIAWVPANNWCPLLVWDSDWDGIIDTEDQCPATFWVSEFNWCPSDGWDNGNWWWNNGDGWWDSGNGWGNGNGWWDWWEGPVWLCGGANGACQDGYVCSIFSWWPWQWVCLLDNVCALTLDGGSSWNVVCNTCPCDFSVDFNSDLKICDIVFPAITSPDGSQIYSKWPAYQILE